MSKILNNHIKVEETRSRKEGYNWISTLKFHCIVSGLLAIVSIILFACISIISSLSNFTFERYMIFGVVELILVISFILFVVSTDLYISAISFNMVNLSVDIKEPLKKACEEEKLTWEDFFKKQLAICKKKKNQAKIVCNVAILLLFITFIFIMPSGNGFFVLFAGIGYLIWQLLSE